MKSESQQNARKRQDSTATVTRATQHDAERELESTTANGRDTETGYFRAWWSEYQKKIESAFQVMHLKLQIQGEQ